MDSFFSFIRYRQEMALQHYLLDHDFVIDQWPDPCLPIIWHPENNQDYGLYHTPSPDRLFSSSDDGFCFHFFGDDYEFRQYFNENHCYSYAFFRSDEPKVQKITSGWLTLDKKQREKCMNDAPVPQLQRYQKQISELEENRKVRRIRDDIYHIHQESEPDEENMNRITLWNKFVWLLMIAAGAVCVALVSLCAYWYLKGMDGSDVYQVLETMAAQNSHWTAKSFFWMMGSFVYAVLTIPAALVGSIGFWICEGILLILILVMMVMIHSKLGGADAPFGKKARDGRNRAKQLKSDLKEPRNELKQAKQELQTAIDEIKNTQGYKDAEYWQKWWINNCSSLASEWHQAWFDCYIHRANPPKIPPLKVRKNYEERIILSRVEL